MRTIQILLFSVVISFLSCDKQDNPTGIEAQFLKDQRIIVDGDQRDYHLYLTENPSDKPLVILLHGHGGSHNQSIGDDGTKAPQKVWISLAEQEGFSAVVPNGFLGPQDTRGWNDCRTDAQGNPTTDDVKFIKNLLDKIQADYGFDDRRVYVSGISNGASMASRLAQEMPDRLAAFASVINNKPGNSECSESTIPISALFMNGTADPLVPYNGGQIASNRGLVISTEASVEYWVGRNGADIVPIVENIPDVDTDDESTIVKYTYPNGANGTEVVLYKVIGGGHTEPSFEERFGRLYLAIVGVQNGDLEMAYAIWDFFKDKSR